MPKPQGKLLLVTRDVDGGLGQHFVDLAEGMAARGWDVHCVRAEDVEGHVTKHSARLDALPGVTVHAIPLARAIGPGDVRSYLAFRRIVKRHGPFDIAHGHGAKAGVLVRLPCRGLRASVYTPHGFITVDPAIDGRKKAIYAAIEGIFARFFTEALVAVSTQERDEALRLGVAKTRCHTVPNGMLPPGFLPREQARREIGLGTEHRVALFVGRFCPQKAPERFVALISNLALGRPTLRGVMIGGGPTKQALIDRTAALEISDRVVFFESTKASSYMRAADLLVVPSRYEGFPYTMIEALAAGLPIITYDVGGADDLVVRAHNGYVVPQDDKSALAFRCAEVLDDAKVRSGMAEAARDRFRLFDLDTMLDRIAGVYAGLQADRLATRQGVAKAAGSSSS